MARLKESDNKNVEKLEPSYTAGRNRKWYSLFGKQAVSQMIKHSYHMTQQLHSWVYTQENWKRVHTQKSTPMFIAALFIKPKVETT